MILLDSSILIDLFRKKNKAKTRFYDLTTNHTDFCISTITNYEIGIGNKESHYEFWERLKDSLQVLPFDEACSDNAIELYLNLLKKNQMIDLADILIGATAITHKIPIATLNDKHFKRIKGLEIIQ